MTDRQLMQQALEALEFDRFTPEDETHRYYTKKAITALRTALEQPEQEPVATVVKRQYEDGTYAGNALDWAGRNCEDDFSVGTKLYTDPQPVKFNCTVVDDDHPNGVPLSQWGKQQKQKPFCYHDGRNIVGKEYAHHCDVFPLYTAPPLRQWQGLTEEDLFDIAIVNFGEPDLQLFIEMGKLVQEELKEKNT